MTGELVASEEDGRLLSARIADEIRSAVLSGEMRPGMRDAAGAARQRVRSEPDPRARGAEAAGERGLGRLAPNRGAWIADVNSEELIEVYKIREVVEPLAIFESVPNLTDADIASLDATVRELETVTTVEEYIQLDRQFHLRTYARAKMPLMQSMIERFWNTTQHLRRQFVKEPFAKDGLPFSDPHHLLLMETIRLRDAEGAQEPRQSPYPAHAALDSIDGSGREGARTKPDRRG